MRSIARADAPASGDKFTRQPKADILAEVLASVIHLHTRCDEDLQGAISDELDSLPE